MRPGLCDKQARDRDDAMRRAMTRFTLWPWTRLCHVNRADPRRLRTGPTPTRRCAVVVGTVLAIATVGCAEGQPHRNAPRCGGPRRAIMTLADPDAAKVDLQTPTLTSVTELRSVAVPARPGGRVAPLETTSFALVATVRAAKLEANGDLDLMLEDASGGLRAALPNPACLGRSPARDKALAARRVYEATCGALGRAGDWRSIHMSALVVGIGFLGARSGAGAAPNGIELAPITGLHAHSRCGPLNTRPSYA